MKIGELADVSGCSIQTIRYYEKERLLSAPHRSDGNFRLYNQAILDQLLFVKHCRSLDISLKEIRQLVTLKQSPSNYCEDINILIDTHIQQVDQRIKELHRLKKQLTSLRQKCRSNQKIEDCGILQNLSEMKIG